MKDLLEISCGLDVHKEKIVACILTGPLGKPTRSEIREFSTLIPDMIALRHWIVSKNCHHVAMESTGIYWMPIYEILEDAFSGDITLLVVNARHMKNVPGKKTDVRDSEWISTLLRAGLLNGSFIPEVSHAIIIKQRNRSLCNTGSVRKSRKINGFTTTFRLHNGYNPSIEFIVIGQSRHEKDLVLCLMRILARCVEVLRQFDFPLKGRSELFEPRRGEF